mmetsp:Transcript_63879/g.104700  ORF Transcript_63879/g.104700 Transcript_63879/m.104700 type:complete len:80 (-) Transcript_63879:226-465(-)
MPAQDSTLLPRINRCHFGGAKPGAQVRRLWQKGISAWCRPCFTFYEVSGLYQLLSADLSFAHNASLSKLTTQTSDSSPE